MTRRAVEPQRDTLRTLQRDPPAASLCGGEGGGGRVGGGRGGGRKWGERERGFLPKRLKLGFGRHRLVLSRAFQLS